MPTHTHSDDERLIQDAIRAASTTRLIRVERDARRHAAPAFQELFGQRPAVVIADTNTFAAAGKEVVDSFRQAGHKCLEPYVFEQEDLHAEYPHVESIKRWIERHNAIPVAVGSGTINDMTKLASHDSGRPYLVVATAASMDGYTAFGASINRNGSKQTFNCPAPVGVLADLTVIESAPEGMNASGYADLLAKVVAGADWIVADALGIETIDPVAWEMMHSRLRDWIDEPQNIRKGETSAIHCLVLGLLMGGLAMQRTKTSRVASGADHQFSHLWDMQNHICQGKVPSHGFKVGIGTLASSGLYEQLLTQQYEEILAEEIASQWLDLSLFESDIRQRFELPSLTKKALEETRAKYVSAEEVTGQLKRLKAGWQKLKDRLGTQLLSFEDLSERLAAAGCPSNPEQIGISPSRLRESYRQAYYVRRRFTVLDLAVRTQCFELALEELFGSSGRWPDEESEAGVEIGGYGSTSSV